MSEEVVTLNYGHFESQAAKMLNNLICKEEFTDVTLVADGQQIKAHKFILSFCSPFFENMFKQNPHPHPLIYLKGVSFENLKGVIEFVYQGEIMVNQDMLASFLETGNDLQIKFFVEEENVCRSLEGNQSEQTRHSEDERAEIICDTKNEVIGAEEMFLFEDENTQKGNQQSRLNRFMKEDEQFECDECDGKYRNLSRHKKTVHLKERFQCDQCDSILKRKDHLKQHILSVHEGMRYSCDQCQFTATYPQMVTSHKKKVHC